MTQLDPNNDTVRWAVFGEQVTQFLQSDIGDYLIKKSEGEIEAAMLKLKDVDPTDVKAITALQNEIKIAEKFQVWLGDAIAAGHQAKVQIEEENE